MRFVRACGAAVLLLVVSTLTCRKAEAVPDDPMLREADEALVQYIRIDTSNPPGNESAGAKFLQSMFGREGIETKLIGSDPARQSLYARLKSGSNEKALLLLHHIDVVPAQPSEWTRPPFSGAVADGYIWGRGALDVKSLGIAEAMAMIEMKRRKAELKRDVVYLAVADEEMGGGHGCKELLEKYPELFANVGFVLNEGGYNETIVDRVTFWGIETQQKTPLWLRLTAKGMPGHAASPPENGGSVAMLVRAIDRVISLTTPYRLTAEVERYFHAAGKSRTDARGKVLREIKQPLDIASIEKILPPGYKSLLRDTIAVTRVAGGTSVNAIPAAATADIDIRLLPGSASADMVKRVRDAAGKDVTVDVLLQADPAPESSADTDLFRLLDRAMRDDEPGSSVAAVVGSGTSDSRFFRARGVVAYGIAPFKVNYYDADNVHGADERIRAKFFNEGIQLMRRIVADFCGK